MKKVLVVLALVSFMFVSIGCANEKQINGTWYETVGIATKDQQHPCVRYRLVVGNLIWSVLLVEMLVPTIYFVGWSLWEPVSEKHSGCFKNLKAKNGKK